jgi:hypothetical protein
MVKANHTALDKQYNHSKEKFFQLRHHAEARVLTAFRARMALMGHVGELKFAHGGARHEHPDMDVEYGEIHVMVNPDALHRGLTQVEAEDMTSVAGLSGGEKSFAALVLLAATASVSDVPFRIADEFDVFQDEKTRERSMRFLLLDAEQVRRDGYWMQMIMLTPHDVASALTSKEAAKVPISVKKLADPKRA